MYLFWACNVFGFVEMLFSCQICNFNYFTRPITIWQYILDVTLNFTKNCFQIYAKPRTNKTKHAYKRLR